VELGGPHDQNEHPLIPQPALSCFCL